MPPPAASDAARPERDWDGVRLHVVTGKGGTGKTTVAAALALGLATEGRRVLLVEVEGRQGIAQAVRRAADAVRGATRRRRCRRRRACSGWPSSRRPRCWSTCSLFYKPGSRRHGAGEVRGGRLRHDDRARRPRHPADRQGLRGGAPPRARPARLRRGGARRAADRPHHAVPQRERGRRAAGPRGPDPQPGRLDHHPAALAADRRAPGDAARGDARAGDARRRRRA
nr:ArsA-related P-loop ATPase [Angustibacter aerolatus]